MVEGKASSLHLVKLREVPEWKRSAAHWFHTKWDIAVEEYQNSIAECVQNPNGIPQWYLVCNDRQEIVAGCGLIANDFHKRLDLTPNLCALYVEPSMRQQGIARRLLQDVRIDARHLGIERIYLITDHKQFYERCGWEFFCMVACDDGNQSRMYVADAIGKEDRL